MKGITKETLILCFVIIAVVLAFGLGFVANKSDYAVVDKQAELSELFTTTQTQMNSLIEEFDGLKSKFEVMKEMESLSDVEIATMEAIPSKLNELSLSIQEARIGLMKLQFAYAILEQLR